ncbi:MAG: ABC transporter permease [Lachnospiraceae bacterium]|nr:ABC transporter permease [Lachnospiraceae bacterium]
MDKAAKKNSWVSDNGIWVVLIVLVVLASIATGGKFATVGNATTLLTSESVKGIMAFGVALAILSKGIDLSTGAVAALSGVVGAALCQLEGGSKLWGTSTMPAIVGILAAVAIGVFVGFLNGAMVAYLHLHPFIATLGTQLMCRATAKMISNKPVSNLSDGYRFLGRFHSGAFYMIVVVFLIFCICLGFMLNFTRFGKSIYAIGGNDQAARVAGINVEHSLVKVYMWCSLCAAVAGVLLGGRTGSVDPSTTGLNYELDAIAAATVGGTSQTGGICRISGVICGILIMGVINNGLVMMGVDDNVTNIIKGLIIIGSVAFDMRKNRVKV